MVLIKIWNKKTCWEDWSTSLKLFSTKRKVPTWSLRFEDISNVLSWDREDEKEKEKDKIEKKNILLIQFVEVFN